MSLRKASCSGVPNFCRGNGQSAEQHGGVATNNFGWDATVFRVFFTPQVHEIQVDAKQRCPRRLQMLGLIWIAFDLGDLVYGHMLLFRHERNETLSKGHTHHVCETNVDIVAFIIEQLSNQSNMRNTSRPERGHRLTLSRTQPPLILQAVTMPSSFLRCRVNSSSKMQSLSSASDNCIVSLIWGAMRVAMALRCPRPMWRSMTTSDLNRSFNDPPLCRCSTDIVCPSFLYFRSRVQPTPQVNLLYSLSY